VEGAGVGKRRIVIVTGEIDLGTGPELQERLLDAALPGDADVVADLAEVTFLDSTGLAALAVSHRRLAADGHKLIVRNPRPMIRRVIEITGLDTVIPIEDTDGGVVVDAAETDRP